ncbi:CHAT domain-containing protein [Actinocorallia aurea]
MIRWTLRSLWKRYLRTGDPRPLKGDGVHRMLCLLVAAHEGPEDSRLVHAVTAVRGAHLDTPEERFAHALQQSEITLLFLGVRPEDVPGQLAESLTDTLDALQRAVEDAAEERQDDARFEDREPPAPAAERQRDRFLIDLPVEFAADRRAELPEGHPDRPARTFQQAQALLSRYEAYSERADLEQAVALGEEAVATETRDPARVRARTVLSHALRLRFQASGDPADLDGSVRVSREGVELAAPGSVEEIAVLSHLDAALLLRYLAAGAPADLADAERHARRVLELAGPGHAERAVFLSTLVAVLRARFDLGGDGRATLDEMVGLAEEAVRLAPDVVPLRSRRLSALGEALSLRYEVAGDFADLREAIAVRRAAVDACPAAHPEHPVHRFNLALALFARYLRNGAAADLDDAVLGCREAVARTPPGHVHGGGLRAHLAIILRARHSVSAAEDDLAEAISMGAQAVADLGPANPRWAWTVSLLSSLHATRYRLHGDPADLAEAVRLGRTALEATPPGRRDRAVVLNNLATVLTLSGDEAADALAVELARESAAGAAPNAESLVVLSAALVRRARQTGEDALWDEAGAALRAAAETATAPAGDRVDAALAWASLAIERRDWNAAATASQACARLLPLLAWRGLPRQDQERRLVDAGTVARLGAACALFAGRPEDAVEILEQGRNVLLAQALDTRTDAAGLADAHPELARRLADTRLALDALLVAQPGDDPAREGDRRQRLAARWDGLVEEIRGLDGFTDFLRPLDAARIRRAAAEGPLVYLNMNELRSDALIVTPEGVLAVPLPEVTPDALLDNVADFLSVTALGDPASTGGRLLLREVLAWLWEAIARPVLDALELGPTDDPPRVWWLPTGPLTFLPLHAAGTLADGVLDRVVSSYTPTIRSLDHTRGRPAPSPGPPAVVALPDQGLPNARREVAAIRARFPSARALVGADATREAVLQALRECPSVHFACHGEQTIGSPSEAALVLDGTRLGVTDLAGIRLDRAELAFLSACHTARPGLVLQEESLHLAGALHLAGFRHVIGTLWAVLDPVAATIAERVYERLPASGDGLLATSAARALHDTVRHLQANHRDKPHLWAAHIHLGP